MAETSAATSEYEEALSAISSLITRRTRADGTNKGDQFDLLYDYLKILELEGRLSKLNVIHVAGTKGKGSTCTFSESILRSCGFHTGLFTSPHLIDLRERFRLDGVEISEEKFLRYFWWCWNQLKEKATDDVPMPNYFRFLTLLSFMIFIEEQVDVAILEVGLGGKFDPTNVVEAPIVCGISSLGYDHMEILGNTLGQIAGEKAGIFKRNIPAYTVNQPEEAMSVLESKALELDVPLRIAKPLDISMLNGQQLGLSGDHQLINAGLAVSLCHTWIQKLGHGGKLDLKNTSCIPEQFVEGLVAARMQGRAQIVPDVCMKMQNEVKSGELTFYLDGAHSPESMVVCGRWFANAIKEASSMSETHLTDAYISKSSTKKSIQILLFNCMPVRDPKLLLPVLVNTCAEYGVHFQKALFVPSQSVFNKLGANASATTDPSQVDLSWQLTLQKGWRNLIHSSNDNEGVSPIYDESNLEFVLNDQSSAVVSSLPLAIKWLRGIAQLNELVHVQVLVTGSLHLVGDVLRLIKS
ncbi:Folylpolyglutamate synthase [Nymphaea thermarum]|nr:Folylpolyglutamate synthase [Nymphaea thermarum]